MRAKRQNLILVLLLLTSAVSLLAAQNPAVPIPAADEILKTLKKEHPRLLASQQEFQQLKERIAASDPLKKWQQQLHEQAEKIVKEPVSRYEIPDGLRLLGTSRRVLHRVYTLALMHRLEGDRRYAQRAWQELEAAGAFTNWNPRHFLDTAEMTHAFAIGYDWLYETWNPKQRECIRTNLVEKGLKLGLGCYQGTARYGGWTRARHNWNQVCNGGIGMGALAVADEEPAIAAEFLHHALISLQLPMAEFAPDGAWNEGPGYWSYATTYNMAILAGLQSALGTDFGLSKMAGFAEAGMFPIYASGTFGRTFNYADAGEGSIRAPHLFWMATQFQRPAYAAWQLRAITTVQPLDLLWFRPVGGEEALNALPPNKYFREAEVVTLRNSWNDPSSLFVGFKAGDNKANHSHLDLGTFVLDGQGVRWATDLGADNYNLPGYFGNQRWNYYRLRAEGHNTLVINPGKEPDQDPKALTRITRYESKSERTFAIADLTPAYAKQARQVKRGMALMTPPQVVLQDEVQSDKPADIWWFMHTPAQVDLGRDGSTAILSQGKQRLLVQLRSPRNAALTVRDAEPLPESPQPEKQASNSKVRKLAIHLKDATDVRVTVLMTPLGEKDSSTLTAPQVKPLSEW